MEYTTAHRTLQSTLRPPTHRPLPGLALHASPRYFRTRFHRVMTGVVLFLCTPACRSASPILILTRKDDVSRSSSSGWGGGPGQSRNNAVLGRRLDKSVFHPCRGAFNAPSFSIKAETFVCSRAESEDIRAYIAETRPILFRSRRGTHKLGKPAPSRWEK